MKALIHQKKTLLQYHNHPSIQFIKTKNKSKTYKFKDTNTDEIKKFMKKLDPKKASQKSDMSKKILLKMQLFSPSISAMIPTL